MAAPVIIGGVLSVFSKIEKGGSLGDLRPVCTEVQKQAECIV